jgi:uncharacterized protein (DUF1501 family)
MMIARRHALGLMAGTAAALPFGGVRIALAAMAGDKRLVVVILRGALDGLAAVPPYADPDYRSVRGALAFKDELLDLDGKFGLHPALAALHEMYRARELLAVHAVATPYRSRSHFDAQDLLENGTAEARGARDGWLNRAILLMGAGDRRLGLAVGETVPLLLRGPAPVSAWAPQQLPAVDADFLAQLATLYRGDPLLGPAIREGVAAQRMNDSVLGEDGKMAPGGPRVMLKTAAGAVGKLLADKAGPRVAVLEVGGWDTHANQGLRDGRLAGNLAMLDEGLGALKTSLGPAWRDTAVLVVTEFGRTAAPNGTNGTDHGTGGIAFLAGGAVAGGRVVTRWPGLARLFEGRDLAPTTDLRAVAKGVLGEHLGLDPAAVDRVVFPNSGDIAALRGLARA